MISTVDSGLLRLGLRIYFIGTLLLISMIGGLCCKSAAKYDLLKGNHVKLNRMTGWVQFRDVLVVMWKLRRLPGGWWLGFTMIVASALALVSDLAVSKLVYNFDDHGLCDFDQGLVFNAKIQTFQFPQAYGYPAVIASYAQPAGNNINRCHAGIYKKIPLDVNINFCANEDDVMGRWACSDLNRNLTFAASENETDIAKTLLSSGLQYPNAWKIGINDAFQQQSTHLVLWSSNTTDDDRTPFHVLVSVDLTGTLDSPKIMQTYNCTLDEAYDGNAEINKVLSSIHSVSALEHWAQGLDGVFYYGADTDATRYRRKNLERYLNSMTMVQAGSCTVLSKRLKDDTDTYGCIVKNTWIAPSVLALVVFTAFILIVTILYYIMILTTLTCGSLKHSRKPIKSIPNDLISWMLQAARENSMANQPGYITAQHMAPLGIPGKSSELREWNVTVLEGSDGIARVVREKGERTKLSEEHGYDPIPMTNTEYISPEPPMMSQSVLPLQPPMPMQQNQQNFYGY